MELRDAGNKTTATQSLTVRPLVIALDAIDGHAVVRRLGSGVATLDNTGQGQVNINVRAQNTWVINSIDSFPKEAT